MFTIGELSRLIKVSPRMLRYYEKEGLFLPDHINKVNGYRIYLAEQIPLLLNIIRLRDMGFGVDEISDFLDGMEQEEDSIQALRNKKQQIRQDILEKEFQIELLDQAIVRVEDRNPTITCGTVCVKRQAEIPYTGLRQTLNHYNEQTNLWQTLASEVDPNLLKNASIAVYHGFDAKEKIDIEVGFLNKAGACMMEEELVVSVECIGPYAHVLPEGEARCIQWADENHYTIIGSERVIGHQHMMNQEDEERYRTEIQFPVRKEK